MLDKKKAMLIGLALVVTVAGTSWLFAGSSEKKERHGKSEHNNELSAEKEEGHGDHDDHEKKEEGHDDHDDHGKAESGDSHNEHDEDEERGVVHIPHEQQIEFGIESSQAGPGKLELELDLSGEVTFNADRVAHIVPRVPGIVLEVKKTLGDTVEAGEVLAVLESRELANAKAAYLASRERRSLAQSTLDREKGLWEKKITSEQEYLNTKTILAEAKIDEQAAEQQLHALGLNSQYLEKLGSQHDDTLTRYEVVSPINGVITEKHITIGEKISGEDRPFTVADVGELWVDLTLYQKDLISIRKGQEVTIHSQSNGIQAKGVISWISSFLDESTRTATARITINNEKGLFFPGMFVSGKVAVEHIDVALLIKKTGIQTVESQQVVFIHTGEEFRPRPIKLGREDHSHIEVTAGIFPGQSYVHKNSFTLKAELEKDSFGGGHAH